MASTVIIPGMVRVRGEMVIEMMIEKRIKGRAER